MRLGYINYDILFASNADSTLCRDNKTPKLILTTCQSNTLTHTHIKESNRSIRNTQSSHGKHSIYPVRYRNLDRNIYQF